VIKYVIVGGVAGGATTAARLRRLDEKAEIILFERGQHISYANCGLPYYIGGKIEERDKLLVQTPEDFEQRFSLEVRTENEVQKINKEEKYIEVKNLKTGQLYQEQYDKLVLSPGARPVRPPIPGVNDSRIFTIRNVSDTDRIKEYIDQNNPQRAVIVGGGFIGLEMAENLHKSGIFSTIVEMAEQVMTPLDYEMAAEVHQHLKVKGVEFYLSDPVMSFEDSEDRELAVVLKSGKVLQSDMVVLAIGVRPETELAEKAGLDVGEHGIKVNEYLQTSDEDIYAVGDAIEYECPFLKKKKNTYLAGPANRQGRLCADNLVKGNKRKYEGSTDTAIAKVFDLTVASTGLSEKTLKNENIDYISTITHSASHAGYYPGAKPMSIKITYAPDTGKLFGAQIIGYDGVDKRIDMLASVLKFSGTIYDVQEIEHAYAPPFSSAKDPVNIAGYVAENVIQDVMPIVDWQDVKNYQQGDTYLLDVRTKGEYNMDHIENSVNIPVDELRNNLDKIPADKKIYVYCAAGIRGYLAVRILKQHGFDRVYNLTGGIKTYNFATQKQSNEDIFEGDYFTKDDILYDRSS
jgi:NADPH-dependent 2,4-dienoyl-CoA reductase/sulfur reductase-like enzyme/rhodanese-related sulfurtransferase